MATENPQHEEIEGASDPEEKADQASISNNNFTH